MSNSTVGGFELTSVVVACMFLAKEGVMELPNPLQMKEVTQLAQRVMLEEQRQRERLARERARVLEDRTLELLFAEMAIKIRHAAEDGCFSLEVYTVSRTDWHGTDNYHPSALISCGRRVFDYFVSAGFNVMISSSDGQHKIVVSWKALPSETAS